MNSPTSYLPASAIFANGSITGTPWQDVNNIFLVDGNFAVSDGTSDFTISNFNLNIPVGSTVLGFEIELIGKRGAQTSPVISLSVDAYDNTNGANAFYPYTAPVTSFTTSVTTVTIGSPTYLFGTTWTVDQANNLKLAFTANGDISLDDVLVRAYFTPPATNTLNYNTLIGTFQAGETVTDTVSGATGVVVTDNGSSSMTITNVVGFFQPGNAISGSTSGATALLDTTTAGVCVDCSSPIQVQAMYLESPFLSGQTKFYLKKGSFSYPNGIPVQPGDIGSCGGTIPFVFDESKKKADGNFEENAMLDTTIGGTWVVLASGVIEVDLVNVTQRGLDFKTPGGHVAANMSDHDANSKVIISNNEPYNLQLLRTCQQDTVFAPPIIVKDEGVQITPSVHSFDFVGPGVSATAVGNNVTITVPGAGGTTPPSVVSVSTGTTGNVQATSLTYAHTTSGTDRLLVVEVSTELAQTITGITFNGVALIQRVTASAGALRSEIWTLTAPFLGTANIVITMSGAAYITSGAETFVNVDQTTPTGATQNATATSTAPSLVLATTRDNSLVVDSLSTGLLPIAYTRGAGQTTNWNQTSATDTRQGASSVESAGSFPDNITMSWTLSQSTQWVTTALEIMGIVSAIGSQAGIQFEDEGVNLGTPGTVDEMDFVGAGVTATRALNKVTVTIPGGGAGSGTALERTITQVAHGFSIGDVVRLDGITADTYTLAQADSAANAEVEGIVVSVPGVNSFVLATGKGSYVAYAPVAVTGSTYFLSDVTPGALTTTAPTALGTVRKPILTVITSGAFSYFHNYIGQENNGIGNGGAIYTNGTDTHDASTTTTNTIAHGLGVIPEKVRIEAIAPDSANHCDNRAITVYNGVTQSSLSRYGTNGGIVATTFAITDAGGAPVPQTGVVTFDATNIYITWTTVAAGIFTLIWEAETVVPPSSSAGSYTVNADETVSTFFTWQSSMLGIRSDAGDPPVGWDLSNFVGGGTGYGGAAGIQNLSCPGNGYMSSYLPGTGTDITYSAAGGKELRWKFRYQSGTTQGAGDFLGIGIADADVDLRRDEAATQASVRIVNNANVVYLVTSDGAAVTATNITASLPMANGDPWAIIEVIFRPGISAEIYVNGVLAATNTTDLPVGSLQLFGFGYTKAGTNYTSFVSPITFSLEQ